eukprot:TRINITY_DN77892_c0_g1_i1.p1 TRINITY_DN77892_c0_g1~~TRINITY_DN77892_c0_g1_i1.p1  ORF type:complete len:391 (-),score=43.03 TRINITY_DN77892_c0_g1_i1:67-1239(-)
MAYHWTLIRMTLCRFCVLTAVCLCPLEVGLHVGSKAYPDLKDKHYTWDNATNTATWTPVNQCALPPHQPFFLQYGLNAFKLIFFMLVLGTGPWLVDEDPHASVPFWKRWVFVVLTFYTWIMIPITAISTIAHFIFQMGPFDSPWDAYECFGILWIGGPWCFNVCMLYLKQKLQFGVYGFTDCPSYDGTGFLSGDGVDKCCEAIAAEKSEWHDRSVLSNLQRYFSQQASVVNLEVAKGEAFGKGLIFTAAPFLVVLCPFIITHILPSVIIFFPEAAVLGALFFVIYCFSFVSERSGTCMGLGTSYLKVGDDLYWTLLERAGGLPLLPILAGFSIILDVLFLQMAYFYNGDGYLGSMAEVGLERCMEYYVDSFEEKVMSCFYAVANLVNEAT